MVILFTLVCTLYVLWLISMAVMGTTQHFVSFTIMFVLLPFIVVIVAFLAPLSVIFSKAAREEAKKKLNSE